MSAAGQFLADGFALIILTATVLAFLAKRTKQPALIAYLATGLVLGPAFLDIVTATDLVELMAELGLGFLLFLIGMEMKFEEIREMLGPVTRIALGQTVLQTGLAFAISYLLGFNLVETTILALCTVFGATPVVVKLLADKDEISTPPGKIDVGVLLIQDIILIITLTVLSAEALGSVTQIVVNLFQVFVLVGVIGAIALISSKWFLPVLFARIADDTHAFFVHGIAWAFVFISLSQYLDVSLEVGAFLAGLSLAQLPYTSDLRERVRPITSFFMVVFFSSIGLRLTADHLLQYWGRAVIASAALMVGNFLIMFYLIDREQFTPETSFKGSINMTQVSEFSLVVGALAVDQEFIGEPVLGYISLMALMTMGVSAYCINYNQLLYERFKPYLARFESAEKTDVAMETLEDHAVIIGYDALARELVPVLDEHFDQVVIVDRKAENTDALQDHEHRYVYGDVKHGEIRNSAGVGTAACIISLVPDHDVNMRLLEDRREDALAFVRSEDPQKAAELYDMGADYVVNRKILAASKLVTYIQDYLKDREMFAEETGQDEELIWWRNHYG